MVRKTALVTAMLGAFASNAYALGLGEIKLNSALNQPLDAEVAVRSATPRELDELNVVLASPEAYNRAGVDRIFLHTKLRFAVEERPDGTAVIHITSQDAVREPYLDFLIEARWGSGQVVREYTMLIDPPVMMRAEPQPAPRAPATAPEPRATRTAPPAPAAPAPAPPVRATAGYSGNEYGPTQRNDTLWQIAEKVRPQGASMHQTMLGLLEANPEAFYNGNINNLKAGYVLRVPERETMTAVPQQQAVAEVRRQHRLWRDGRTDETRVGRVDREAPPAPAAASQPAETTASAAVSQDEPKLKLVAPDASGGDATAGNGAGSEAVSEVRKELSLAVEELEAQRQQNSELNDRLAELENQIAQLHRLVQLSDEELARLQAAQSAQSDSAGQTVEQAEDETAGQTPELAGEQAADDTTGLAGEQAEAQSEAVADESDSVAAGGETEMASTAEAGDQGAGETATAAPEPTAADEPPAEQTVIAEEVIIEQPTASDEGFISRFMRNPLWQAGAGAAAVLLLLLAWLAARRRRMEATEFQESILAEPKDRAGDAAAEEGAAAAAAAAAVEEAEATPDPAQADEPDRDGKQSAGPQSDSSLFTDFAVSDMGAIQDQAEADPIAEADVYLAYGRYKQAEELIRGAVDREPQRNDLRVKLLEIYFAAKNQSGFDTEAQALLANLDSQEDPDWQRVVEMGRELNPANPLYQDGASAAAAAPQPAEPDPMETDAAEAERVESADFDMESFAAEPGESLDLDDEQPVAAGTPDSMAEDANTLDFSMEGLEDLDTASGPETVDEDSQTGALDDDNLLEFDLGSAEAQAGEEEDESLELDDGALQSSDEVSTKLDLARAYIEMGDPEGAKSILDEVMEEGNDNQKGEAENLLREVG